MFDYGVPEPSHQDSACVSVSRRFLTFSPLFSFQFASKSLDPTSDTLWFELGHFRTLKHLSEPSYRKSGGGLSYGVDIAPRQRGLCRNIQYKPQIDTNLLYQPNGLNCHMSLRCRFWLWCRPIQPNIIKEDHT